MSVDTVAYMESDYYDRHFTTWDSVDWNNYGIDCDRYLAAHNINNCEDDVIAIACTDAEGETN